ncbi:MAG: mechanosensitive ion channel family protein [Peptococcaceae bacterium]|nr:mechanosensitive ion channel family protein [Peptococcaceae bacterium]
MLEPILASSDSVAKDVADGAADTAESVASNAIDQLKDLNSFFSLFKVDNLLGIAVRILVIVLVLTLSYRLVRFLLNRAYQTRYRYSHISGDSKRQLETARHMVQSIIFYCFLIFGAIAILSLFGFDMRGLAASAGIAGAALVFISQNMILDWINGVFILVERQFNVGDYVKIGEFCGTVENITVRHTVICTDHGEIVTIPNGDINTVVNYSKAPVTEYFDVRIHDASRLDEGERALLKICERINEQFKERLTSPCSLMGVQDIVGTGAVLRLTFSSSKADTYPILRALRAECIHSLSALGLQQQLSH